MLLRTGVCTTAALVAFAGNSIIARLALRDGAIDAAGFSAVRLLSGAAVLVLIVGVRGRQVPQRRRRRLPALALFVYAVGFSFAYVSLNASAGALILFATVQLTMLGVAWVEGDRLHGLQSVGLVMALAGLVYLVLPGLEAPPLAGSVLMLVAGVAWGWYSLLGRGISEPIDATAHNFLWTVPLVLALAVVTWPQWRPTFAGIGLAVLSGAVTSGLGYVIWYAALAGLRASQAATAQLTVPVLDAWGGAILLDEAITTRLVLSASLILAGVGLTLRRPRLRTRANL